MGNQLKKAMQHRGIEYFQGTRAHDYRKHTKRKEKAKEKEESKRQNNQ
jgi:hypothetical protein